MKALSRSIGNLGHRIADFDTQSGICGAIMRLCWFIGFDQNGEYRCPK